MQYYNAIGTDLAKGLHNTVCPAFASIVPANLQESYWWPSQNRPLWDLIHALVVAHMYAPKNFRNYNVLTYLVVVIIALGPSYTLRALVTGEPWAFLISPTIGPCLLLSVGLVLLTGGLPQPIVSVLSIINHMSSVNSVHGGVVWYQNSPRITGAGAFLGGILHGCGGLVWSILVNAWFGSGLYQWERIPFGLPMWIVLSTVWNVFYWSNCNNPSGSYTLIVEITLFCILVVDSFVRARPSPASSSRSKPAPPPKSKSASSGANSSNDSTSSSSTSGSSTPGSSKPSGSLVNKISAAFFSKDGKKDKSKKD